MKHLKESDWLSNRLHMLRKQKKTLAELMGIHPQHINRLLLKIKLTPAQFEQLSSFLECDYLMLQKFWGNKITADQLFNETLSSGSVSFNLDDLSYILNQIDAWLVFHEKQTDTRHKLELAFAIYDATRSTPDSLRKAQIIQLLDFQTKMKLHRLTPVVSF